MVGSCGYFTKDHITIPFYCLHLECTVNYSFLLNHNTTQAQNSELKIKTAEKNSQKMSTHSITVETMNSANQFISGCINLLEAESVG